MLTIHVMKAMAIESGFNGDLVVRRQPLTCFKQEGNGRLVALEEGLVAEVSRQQQQHTTAHAPDQRTRTALAQEADEAAEQHHEAIWIRETEVVHLATPLLRRSMDRSLAGWLQIQAQSESCLSL